MSSCSSCTQLLLTWSSETVTGTGPFSVLLVPPSPLVTFPRVRAITPNTDIQHDASHWSVLATLQTCPPMLTEQCVAAVGDRSIPTETTTQAVSPCSCCISFHLYSVSILQFQHQDGFKGRKNENKGIRLPSLHLNVVCISVLMLQFLKYPSRSCDLPSTCVYLYRYQQTNPIN